MNLRGEPQGLAFPWSTAPGPGEAVSVAEGVYWLRLPLPMASLNHANVYALEDEIDGRTGWTLIDTGMNWSKGRSAMEDALAGPLAGRPVLRVILTHHHPDHIGLAGRFATEGAEIWASRTAWLLGRMLTLDRQEQATPEQIRFRQRAGMTGEALAAYAAEKPFNFADVVLPIPLGFRRIEEGDRIRIGPRDWLVRMGEGHAPEHVTLWSDDGILLAGDQVLPGISSNIGVYATEPEANPLKDWLATCRRFHALEADPLVLPGHKLPFRGLTRRLEHLIENHEHALTRIEVDIAERPKTAIELFHAIFHRPIGHGEFSLALVEAVAHANFLVQAGRIARRLNADGAWEYHLREET